MNTIRAGGRRNIRAVVYQQFGTRAASNLSRARNEFIQYSRCQGFFADLNEIDFCCNRSFD